MAMVVLYMLLQSHREQRRAARHPLCSRLLRAGASAAPRAARPTLWRDSARSALTLDQRFCGMTQYSDHETWLIEAGNDIITRKAGGASLSPLERIVYCLWVADYGMRNAGDLVTARDLYPNFQRDAADLAGAIGLPFTRESFSLPEESFRWSTSSGLIASATRSKRSDPRNAKPPGARSIRRRVPLERVSEDGWIDGGQLVIWSNGHRSPRMRPHVEQGRLGGSPARRPAAADS